MTKYVSPKIFFLWYLVLVGAPYAHAGGVPCVDGCCLPPQAVVGGEQLEFRGISTFRRWGFKVYTGALYVSPGASPRDAILSGVKKKLILCFHRSLTTDQFIEKSEEILGENPENSLERLRPQLTGMNKLYVPVKEGDTYAISYEPSSTTMRLFFNDRELGSFPDATFARAYFGIWLSKHSVSERFTEELLGVEE